MSTRLALILFALSAPAVYAQSAGDDAGSDAGVEIPDASVGSGGSQDDGTGDDTADRVVAFCTHSSDCSRGFACFAGRCRPIGVRNAATDSCLGTAMFELAALAGLAYVHLRGRR